MKYLRIITIALICMGFLSCEKRHINDNLYDSSVYIINHGLQTVTLYDVEGKSPTFAINTYCGGFYGENPNVRLVYNQDGALDAFNQTNGTSYKLLPENCYKLDSRHMAMENSKVAFIINFDCDKIAALSEKEDYSDLANYVIPYTLVSETDGIAPVEDRQNVFITVDMNKMSFRFVAPAANDITSDEEYFYLQYKLQAVVENQWESGYVLEHNFDEVLGEDNYTFTSSADRFVPGVSEIVYDLKISRENLYGFYYDLKVNVSTVEDGFNIVGDTSGSVTIDNQSAFPIMAGRRWFS